MDNLLVDFSKIEFDKFNQVEKPTIILAQPDKTIISSLGYAYGLTMALRYTNLSEIKFTVPHHVVDNETNETIKVPFYNDIIGDRLIRIDPFGWFKLRNPKITSDGIKEVKECVAYSLETEFGHKKLTGLDGTFKFFDLVTPDDSLLGIIMSLIPSWSIGEVDPDLWYNYKTFTINDQNLYNFMMNEVQNKYKCIFEFDTYNRKINVKALANIGKDSLAYFSFNNLIKDIEITELSDETVTLLEVFGQSPVDIRAVNPTGENVIRDYTSKLSWIDVALANKWRSYQTRIDSAQSGYATLRSQYRVRQAAILTQQNRLNDLNNELVVLTTLKATKIQQNLSLVDINRQIATKEYEITIQQQTITSLQTEIDSIYNQIIQINNNLVFKNNFTTSEIIILDTLTKEDTLQDDTYVYTDTTSDSIPNISVNSTSGNLSISSGTINKISDTASDIIYDLKNNTFSINFVDSTTRYYLSGEIRSGNLSIYKTSTRYIFSADFINSTLKGVNLSNANDYQIYDVQIGNVAIMGNYQSQTILANSINLVSKNSNMFVTQASTEFSKQTVSQELYDYAKAVLNKSQEPSYQFSQNSANFIFLKEYFAVTQSIKMGNTVALELTDEKVIFPVLLEVNLNYENEPDFSMVFGNKFKLSQSMFNLTDIFEESIIGGTNTSFDRGDWSTFVKSGAQNSVNELKTGLLDVAFRGLSSSSKREILINESGLLARNFNESTQKYDPEQLWLVNNMIALSDDGFNTARMALGAFNDPNVGRVFGLVADLVVGTLIAGENLVITNKSPDGKNIEFRMDSTGVKIINCSLTMTTDNNKSKIILDPAQGIKIQGNQNLVWKDVFYVDTRGNAYFEGEINAGSGYIGKFIIDDNSIRSDNDKLTLKYNGSIYMEAGYIGGVKINPNSISAGSGDGSFELNSDGSGSVGPLSWNAVGTSYFSGSLFMDEEDSIVFRNGGEIKSNYAGKAGLTLTSSGEITLVGGLYLPSGGIRIGSRTFKPQPVTIDGEDMYVLAY